MGETIAGYLMYAVIAAALSYAISYFLRKDPPNHGPLEGAVATTAIRGTLLPFLLGRIRVGPTIGWVGLRRIHRRGSSKKGYRYYYYEKGMHCLTIGPGKSLNAIYEEGKIIFPVSTTDKWGKVTTDASLTPVTHPSGSSFETAKGTARIYWGEVDQPVDTMLSEATGVSSRYPYIMYVVWDEKYLGQSRTMWAQLDYDIEVGNTIAPTDGEYILGTTAVTTLDITYEGDLSENMFWWMDYVSVFSPLAVYSTFIFRTTDTDIENAKVGDVLVIEDIEYVGFIVNIFKKNDNSDYLIHTNNFLTNTEIGNTYETQIATPSGRGINPASALYQMLFDTWPHGLGFSKSLFNMGDFDTLADLFKNTEVSPCTVFLKGGSSFQKGIGAIMQDFGLFFYKDTTTGKYGFRALREGDTPTVIEADDVNNDELARAFGYATLNPDKTIYSFKDSARKFKDSTIIVTDDGNAKYSDNPNTKKINLNTITDLKTASMVASRREQEAAINDVVSLKIGYNHIDLKPGDLTTIGGFAGQYRLGEKTIDVDSATIKASFLVDAYSITNNYEDGVGSGQQPGNTIDASHDYITRLVEGNRYLNTDSNVVYFFRVRSQGTIVGATLQLSLDDVSYNTVSDEMVYQSGGVLEDAIDISDPGIIETGPRMTIKGPDMADISNISGDDALWRSGYQVAFIGGEIFYLKNYNTTSGRLEGLLRARFGTKQETHAVGAEVIILKIDDLSTYTTNYLLAGIDLYAKALPYTLTSQIPADEITAEQISYGGGGFRPLSPENLTTDDFTTAWVAGTDIDLRWDFKNATDQSGAGILDSDSPASLSGPEGYFKLEILNGSTVVRTVDPLLLASYTYTNANLVTDFGGEPSSFNTRVVNILNGLTSEEETATITRV